MTTPNDDDLKRASEWLTRLDEQRVAYGGRYPNDVESLAASYAAVREPLERRIAELEAALASMIGTHGEPCREQQATGDPCEALKSARKILRSES